MNTLSRNGVLRSGGQVSQAQLGPNRAAFVLAAAETGGTFSLTEFVMAPPPAPGPPLHRHEDADETVYVLEGALDMTIGERTLSAAPGAVMFVPRGALHGISNPGPGATRMLVILTPPGFEGFWREMSALLAGDGAPPSPEMVLALQRKYHMATAGQARRFDPPVAEHYL
ncbi:MAG: hypothetical protein DCC58_05130 [Chloroflexi bacterium]|nr:MAG: hypothetical protein DCC58_05130 [Chloroflexota bacterium]